MKNLVTKLLAPSWFRQTSGMMLFASSTTTRSFSSTLPLLYPRAAVAVTVQSKATSEPPSSCNYYLLIQRANPPDQGKWSLPGGKIDMGETTLIAAQRELQEETNLTGCQWYPFPFLTTDAIIYDSQKTGIEGKEEDKKKIQFHYVISQCFAQAEDGLPKVIPNDDARDAQWFTLPQMVTMQEERIISEFVVQVIQRAEELSLKGLLL